MRTSKISKRYAKGLLLFAQETNSVEKISTEMKDVLKFINASSELRKFLSSPFIHVKTKISVVEKIFTKFSKTIQNIIILAIKQNRAVHLEDIASQYISLVEGLSGIQKISLTTATELSEVNLKNILTKSTLVDTAKPFDVEIVINPNIIGGYILRVGDQQIDESVRTSLQSLKKEFELN